MKSQFTTRRLVHGKQTNRLFTPVETKKLRRTGRNFRTNILIVDVYELDLKEKLIDTVILR
jgi:hypothetical protein